MKTQFILFYICGIFNTTLSCLLCATLSDAQEHFEQMVGRLHLFDPQLLHTHTDPGGHVISFFHFTFIKKILQNSL